MGVKTYQVLREHEGDRFYARGDIREANEGDVKHLLGKVLQERPKPKPASDGLDKLGLDKLRDLAKVESVGHLPDADKPALIAAIRAKRGG